MSIDGAAATAHGSARLSTTLGSLDTLREVTGGGNDHNLVPNCIELFGIRCLCLDLPTLIRVKRAAGRPEDFEAIAELEEGLRPSRISQSMKPWGTTLILLCLSQAALACCTPTPQIDLTKLIATLALFLVAGPAFGALVSEGIFQAMGRGSDFWRFALSLGIGLFAAAAAAFVLIWSGPLVILTPLISAGVALGVSQASERTDQPEQQ